MRSSILILVVLIIAAVIGWSEYTKRYPAQRFYGVGASDTQPFTMKDKWEISWSCPGPIKIALVPTTQMRMPLVVTDTSSPTMASSYQATGGEYSLQITSSWPWEVSVCNVATDQNSPVVSPAAPAPGTHAP